MTVVNFLLEGVMVFLLWTLVLYLIHRITHRVDFFKSLHYDHHIFVSRNKSTKWKWHDLMLYNDTPKSTLDMWVTEVIPTLCISFFTGHWWLSVMYYIWAAFFQQNLEHNPKYNWYPFTSGKWHLVHHRDPSKNFGLFLPIWDKIFKTEKGITK
jgi:sterol desaturase/sphingolipid hydroxylase (fatty acid hydroxylase superfamily)